jgi:hypothetical protein
MFEQMGAGSHSGPAPLGPVNCLTACDFVGETNQHWCEPTGTCDDGIWWHDNKEWERAKRTFWCSGSYKVWCSSPWIDSGCCGTSDPTVPLCISPGQGYCSGSAE